MNPYYNLPPEQRFTQRLVDQFNADARLWKKLEPRRKARRKLRPRLSKKELKNKTSPNSPKLGRPRNVLGNGSRHEPRGEHCPLSPGRTVDPAYPRAAGNPRFRSRQIVRRCNSGAQSGAQA